MGHNMATWKLLEDMMLTLRKKNVKIPPNILEDLRAAKSLIQIILAEGCHGDSIMKAEEYTANLEAYLVTEAQVVLEPKEVDQWLKRLEEANVEAGEENYRPEQFVTGVPRDQKWVRIQPMEGLSEEQVHRLAKENGVQVKSQDDGRLLVFGSHEALKAFLKAMTAETSPKTEKAA
ncbi:MAG: DUF2096 family protein [Candidatus Bathyarchaeota archaeon]|nr:DUF2096 family protein [Candidatus Bathyarchaeota archaeon]